MDPETATVGEDASQLEARSVDSRSTGSLRDFLVGDAESESDSESDAEVAPDPALLDKPRAMRDRATIRTPKVLYADVEAHTSADLEYEEYLETNACLTASGRRAALRTFKDLPLEEKRVKLTEVVEYISDDEISSEQESEDEEYFPSPPGKKRKREDAE
jgi:hypothetical protein